MFRPVLSLLLCFAVLPSRADVVINEVVHAASERVLKWDLAGTPSLGTGPMWYATNFDDSAAKGWQTGVGPFGFGSFQGVPAITYGVNTQTQMQYVTPTMYLRKSFNVSPADAARTDPLELVVDFNDGFILYVNGVEAARRWAGPPNQFHYHDQPAYDPDLNNADADDDRTSTTVNLGAANTRLVAGNNVIAVHALNISSVSSQFLFSGTLRIGGASPTTLINSTDPHQYLIGTVEPSGGLYDPAFLSAGRLSVPWAKTSYVDTHWTQATGPIGQGTSPLGTTIGGAVGVTPSLYTRIVFNASAAQAADTAPLRLLVDYDDSFVAYLNGVEVARANLQTPNTFVPRTAVANGTRSFGSTSTITLDPANKLLVPGANVLAIQAHNVSIVDTDLAIKADLQTNASVSLVANNSNQWKYLVGTQEPVLDLDGAIEDNPDLPDSVLDWIELHNNGAAPVSLLNWSLTDDPADKTQWVFPNVTIPAGGYLVVVCDGEDIATPAANGYLHTNFKIDADGEYLGLFDQNGGLVQAFASKVPKGSPHHSYIRNAGGQYRYSDLATPGAANAGNEFLGIVEAPSFNNPGGYYAPMQVSLTNNTVGASIRYTLDGSDPTPTSGTVYTGAIAVPSTRSIRARAFLSGHLPSPCVTHVYAISEGNRANLPSVTLTGDESRSLYRPFGVMAIKQNAIGAGGNFATEGTPWIALGDPTQYNNPNIRGRFMERPVTWQMLYPSNAPGFTADIGVRMAGSPFTRPRYVLVDQNRDTSPNTGQWSTSTALRKPSMNFYMRDDLGGDPLKFPVIPNSPVTRHSDFRFRGGHNDMNPFIIDEWVRRLHTDTGQPGSLGANVNLYLNGVYKGIFNICQHVREEWCQEAFGSDIDWDVIQVGVPSDGDLIALQELVTFLRTNSPAVLGNYQGALTRVNATNLVDYLLVNIYTCTGDWPHNNWICGRERSTTGRFHFFTWDAEGAVGGFNLTVASNNFVANPALNPPSTGTQSSLLSPNSGTTEGLGASPRVLYTLLRQSPEFRLLFADRIQKHFFNGGALTDTALLARNTALANEASPFVSGYNSTRIPNWINGIGNKTNYTVTRNASNGISATTNAPSRRKVLLEGFINDDSGGYIPVGPVQPYFRTEGLWPNTLAPVYSQPGGPIGAGLTLTITNPNGVGTIYYTLNGTDPRVLGGAIAGAAYTTPLNISQTTTVKSRVRHTNGEWSPLLEATFTGGSTPSLLITEIMYHPPDQNGVDGDEFEFVEIKNVGANTLELFGMKFTDGIDYAFPAGATIAPAGFVVLAKNPTQFALKYPGVPVLGGYGPSSSLNNAGETLTLRDAANNIIFSVTYTDDPPWPTAPDGGGPSLVPNLPNSNPDPHEPANWRVSGTSGGSPAADDPAPGIPKVQITEILANSVPPAVDGIELYNPESTPANIGGWYLSDDLITPKKYRIPDGTIIPAGGYLVISETAFNTGPNAFAYSQNGDEAVLSSASGAGTLTGLTEFVDFGASEPGVTMGRYTNLETPGRKFFTAMNQNTLGGPNTGPRISPVIISEIHYQPQGSAAEFVEIRNNSNAAIPLFDPANPANTWRLSGINFNLPPGVVLQPRQFILISANSPAMFRSSYAIPAAIPVHGPYNPPADLANAGERVALQMPGIPVPDGSGGFAVPYIDVDYVTYTNTWFSSTAGAGKSLERLYLNGFGDDKNNWRASATNGGNPGRFGATPFSIWQSQWFTAAELADPTISGPNADPDGDGYGNGLEYTMGFLPWETDPTHLVTASLGNDGALGPYLMVTFRKSLGTSGVTVNVGLSGNLIDWGANAVQVGVPIKNDDGTETVTYRDSVLTIDAPRRFMRIQPVIP